MKTGQRCEAARQLSEILDLIARLGPGLTPQGQARLHPLLADVAADVIEMLVETSNGPALKILDDRLRTLGFPFDATRDVLDSRAGMSGSEIAGEPDDGLDVVGRPIARKGPVDGNHSSSLLGILVVGASDPSKEDPRPGCGRCGTRSGCEKGGDAA